MRTLGIETSSAACSVALLENGRLIAGRCEVVGRGHAERLIPWIAALPDGGKADQIIVGCGPGSFTGVRIGIAAARALGLAWDVPVKGISSLALLAAPFAEDPLTVAVNGGHGELFVQDFSGVPRRQDAPAASLLPEAAARTHRHQLVVGDSAARLVAARGFGEARNAYPDIAAILLMGDAPDFLPPDPVYGRGADAKPMA